MSGTDWDTVRKYKLSDDHPPEWPKGVRAVSMKGVALLGIHEKTGKLYWDGEELATSIGLKRYERILATIGAICAVVTTIFTILRFFGYAVSGS